MAFSFLLGKTEAVVSAATTRAPSGLCRPAVLTERVYYFQVSPTLDIPYYYSNNPRLFVFLFAIPVLEHVMALFSKRLTCFYCGRRASHPVRGQVRKFHCEHCEADNYLDQVSFAEHDPKP